MIKLVAKKYCFSLMVVLVILCSTFLSSFYLSRIENKLENDFYGFKFVLENEKPFDASLLYTYDNAFRSDYVLKNKSTAIDTLLFYMPSSEQVLKKFRLDFGNKTDMDELKIKELQLLDFMICYSIKVNRIIFR